MKRANKFHFLLALLCFSNTALCEESFERTFDIQKGEYATLYKKNVSEQGLLACSLNFSEFRFSEDWSPSINFNFVNLEQEKTINIGVVKSEVAGYGFIKSRIVKKKETYKDQFLGLLAHDNIIFLDIYWNSDGLIIRGRDSIGQFGQNMMPTQGWNFKELKINVSGLKGSASCKFNQ